MWPFSLHIQISYSSQAALPSWTPAWPMWRWQIWRRASQSRGSWRRGSVGASGHQRERRIIWGTQARWGSSRTSPRMVVRRAQCCVKQIGRARVECRDGDAEAVATKRCRDLALLVGQPCLHIWQAQRTDHRAPNLFRGYAPRESWCRDNLKHAGGKTPYR